MNPLFTNLITFIRTASSSIIAIVGAMIGSSILLLLTGINPFSVYSLIITEATGTEFGINKTLVETVPFVMTVVGLLISFRASLWNIGGLGQMFIGALFANVIGYSLGFLPSILLIPLTLLAGFVGGLVWALFPGLLKAKLGINEIITTLLLNFVAINLIHFLIKGILRNELEPFPQTYPIAPGAVLQKIPGTQIHIGIFFAIAITIIVHILMVKTRLGFQIKLMGESLKAARYAGLPIAKLTIVVFILSGGIIGLAGAIQVTAVMKNVNPDWNPAYGLEAVPLVFLSKMNVIVAALLAFLYSIFFVGVDIMQRTVGLPIYFREVFLGLMLTLFTISEVTRKFLPR